MRASVLRPTRADLPEHKTIALLALAMVCLAALNLLVQSALADARIESAMETLRQQMRADPTPLVTPLAPSAYVTSPAMTEVREARIALRRDDAVLLCANVPGRSLGDFTLDVPFIATLDDAGQLHDVRAASDVSSAHFCGLTL